MKREVLHRIPQLLRLLLIIFALWHNTVDAQATASFQQYYYYYTDNAVTFAPIVNYKFGNNLYLEGRYNYEDLNTGSLYIGRTFENNSNLSISFTPIAGAVFGFYKGASLGANLYVNYKRLNLSHQPQYTLSPGSRASNFLYSWSDLSLDLTDNIAIGVSAQHTKTYFEKGVLEKGVMLQFSYKRWSLPIYAYNPQSADRYFLLGLNYEWEGKKHKKREEDPEPVFTKPDPVIASKSEKVPVKKEIPAVIESNQTNNASAIGTKPQASSSKDPANSLFALIAGSFSDLNKAEALRAKLLNDTNKPVSIYPENGVYKVRMTGFADRKEVESFRTKVLGNFSTGGSVIYAYRVASLEMDLVEKAKRL